MSTSWRITELIFMPREMPREFAIDRIPCWTVKSAWRTSLSSASQFVALHLVASYFVIDGFNECNTLVVGHDRYERLASLQDILSELKWRKMIRIARYHELALCLV